MRKITTSIMLLATLFVSCQTFTGTLTSQQRDYEIQYVKDWKVITKFQNPQENIEAAIIPENGPSQIGIKITSQVKMDIVLGHIREITADYATKAEKQFPGYKLIVSEYIPTEQANGDEKLHIEFSAIENGQAYTLIQDIYALTGKAISVTATYPEADQSYAKDILAMMDTFKVIYQK
jgi:hypothetical protein